MHVSLFAFMFSYRSNWQWYTGRFPPQHTKHVLIEPGTVYWWTTL